VRRSLPSTSARLPHVLAGVLALIVALGVLRVIGATDLVSAASHHAEVTPVAAAGAAPPSIAPTASVAPLGPLKSADVLLTSTAAIPAAKVSDLRHLPEITGTESFSVGTVHLGDANVPAYGVDPSRFRNWATRTTAESDPFWRSIASGEISASFQTAKDLNLPLGERLPVAARSTEPMRLGSFATVGLPDAEAVLSSTRASEIGLVPDSGLLISAPDADLRQLTGALKAVLGPQVAVRPLKPLSTAPLPTSTASETPTAAGSSSSSAHSTGDTGSTSDSGAASASSGNVDAVIAAARSKLGAPYVYGASGPDSFDCSGFTSWVYRQVGVGLPRTAQEQWLAGQHVSYAQAKPGDILAWAGDPQAPGYATHVAIYLGNGQMIHAPHSGTVVSVASVYSSGLLGAVRVLG
jgi:cell wall-associated NlpC family hydrolase